jgi:Activator of Hsp90 ATPase homolog 1-like protein
MKPTGITVEKTIRVETDLVSAYEVFTEALGSWWPFEGFSISGSQTRTAILEAKVGGRIYEIDAAGAEHMWGTVVACDGPHSITVDWHPGQAASVATRWTATFDAVSDSVTELRLVHTGWEVLGDSADEVSGRYTSGWDAVLSPYLKSV